MEGKIGMDNKRLAERFWVSFIEDSLTGCWNWNRRIKKPGYGRFVIKVIEVYAHRFAYELLRGNIPTGLSIDHLCRNKKCVNPDHLEPVSVRENSRRGNVMDVKLCKRNHPQTPENKFIKKSGKSECKLCKKFLYERAQKKKRAERIYEW